MIVRDMTRGLNHIGRLGENEHRTFRFPESCEALAMYPEAIVTVLHRRPGDEDAYPVAPGYVQVQDGAVLWTIQSGDLARVGRGKCELIFMLGEVVAKSYIYDTMTDTALDGAGDPPEPWESWQTDMAQVAAEVEANRQAAQTAATGAETAKTGAETAQSSAETAARNAATGATAAGDAATAAARSAEQANQSAGTAAGAAGAAGQAATAAGQSAQDAAGSATTAGTKATEAAGSATAAGAAALVSEGYAKGTQRGVQVGTDSPYSGNNAKYFRDFIVSVINEIAQEATAQNILMLIREMTDSTQRLVALESVIQYYDELPQNGHNGYVYITPKGIYRFTTETGFKQISGGDLNGFSLRRGEDDEVVLDYTNPDDETDTDTITMPKDSTGAEMLETMEGITASMRTLAGSEASNGND